MRFKCKVKIKMNMNERQERHQAERSEREVGHQRSCGEKRRVQPEQRELVIIGTLERRANGVQRLLVKQKNLTVSLKVPRPHTHTHTHIKSTNLQKGNVMFTHTLPSPQLLSGATIWAGGWECHSGRGVSAEMGREEVYVWVWMHLLNLWSGCFLAKPGCHITP